MSFRNATMSSSGDVTYNTSHINVGTCVNISTGVFTAPVAGTYYISFMCIGVSGANNADVFLYLNGSKDVTGIWMRPQIKIQMKATQQMAVLLLL